MQRDQRLGWSASIRSWFLQRNSQTKGRTEAGNRQTSTENIRTPTVCEQCSDKHAVCCNIFFFSFYNVCIYSPTWCRERLQVLLVYLDFCAWTWAQETPHGTDKHRRLWAAACTSHCKLGKLSAWNRPKLYGSYSRIRQRISAIVLIVFSFFTLGRVERCTSVFPTKALWAQGKHMGESLEISEET